MKHIRSIRGRTGAKRFACECGQKLDDGLLAIQHTMLGHDTVLETYTNGRWVFRGGSVADYMIEQARAKGESIDAFVSRMEQLAEGMESVAQKAQDARREAVADGI
jgi:hypothetical protein